MSTGKKLARFLFQDSIKIINQGLVIDITIVTLDHIALFVDQKRSGNAKDTAKGWDNCRIPQQNRIVDLHFLGKFINYGSAFLVGGDTDHGEAFCPVFLLKLNKIRYFLATGRTPGGEEIDQ